MLNHVNTVLVSNNKENAAKLATKDEVKGFYDEGEVKGEDKAKALAGKFVVMDLDNSDDPYSFSEATKRFKFGLMDGTVNIQYDKNAHKTLYTPNIRWSNTINVKDIMHVSTLKYTDNKQDRIEINFEKIQDNQTIAGPNGASITLRLNFKDMPTRYRQWTESYNIVLPDATTPYNTRGEQVAAMFADKINKEHRRQRVFAEVKNGTILSLVAMKYDDPKIYDQGYENDVKFNAFVFYTDPAETGIYSANKHELDVTITKRPGTRYPADSLIVRTREIEAWDYMGVLHRCCWFDPTPKVLTDLSQKYDGINIEVENEYHAVDDIRRHTKETLEIYFPTTTVIEKFTEPLLKMIPAVDVADNSDYGTVADAKA